jgi:arginyl-tRNA synthetase
MYLIESLKSAAARLIGEAAGADIDASLLEYPERPENGDLAFPCFSLAKTLRKAPPVIAADLAAKLGTAPVRGQFPLLARVEAAGPYLNFFLDPAKLLDATLAEIEKAGDAYGDRTAEKPEKVMVEYVSPNNNKPLHLGHVRNGLIGSTVSALLESQGRRVVRALLLNDRGLAIAKAMVAYMRWGEGKTPEDLGKKGDHYLGDLYVMYEKAAKGDPSLEEAAREVIRKWEAGDEETRALWKTMSGWCERGQHETYRKLGFRFDVEYKESDIYKEGKEIVEAGLKKGVFRRDETGAVVAPLEAHGLPDKVLLRSDGTALYITQDLYLAKRKFDEHGLDASIYVVGNEQNLHFRQLFKILELLGFKKPLAHLSYGYVTLPEGRMKSREGTVIDADDLVAALEADAAVEIRQRHATIPDDELVRRAHQVAMAAIKFHFLEVDIASDMVYDPKASLSFTGRTGPYLQYMHARIQSIFRKAADDGSSKVKGQRSKVSEEESRLALLLAKWPETVAIAAASSRPSLVALHLYETARAIAAFYEKVPVLAAPGADRAARLRLLAAARAVLRRGFRLLGISPVEEM